MATFAKRLTAVLVLLLAGSAFYYGMVSRFADPRYPEAAYEPVHAAPTRAELRSQARRIAAACAAPEGRDYKWRWYPKDYPDPGLNWALYSVNGLLCHGSPKHWLGIEIEQRELDRYGCFAAKTGFYCQGDAAPDRHPEAEDLLG